MTSPAENSEFCFPSTSMFPSASPRETPRVSGKKTHCQPLGQSLSAGYIAQNFHHPVTLTKERFLAHDLFSQFS